MSQQNSFKKNQAVQAMCKRLAEEIVQIYRDPYSDKIGKTQALIYASFKEPDENQTQSGRQNGDRNTQSPGESKSHRSDPMEAK